jgi:hypothetical protein
MELGLWRPWPSSEASAARLRKLTSARLLRHGNRKALQDTPNLCNCQWQPKSRRQKDRLDRERDVLQMRVANFKANQRKFQQEREDYCTRTMSDARATQWTPPSRDNDKPLAAPIARETWVSGDLLMSDRSGVLIQTSLTGVI